MKLMISSNGSEPIRITAIQHTGELTENPLRGPFLSQRFKFGQYLKIFGASGGPPTQVGRILRKRVDQAMMVLDRAASENINIVRDAGRSMDNGRGMEPA